MGILDDISAGINLGTATASRSVKATKLKAKIAEAEKRRQKIAADLGAALYLQTHDDAQLRCGNEMLYDGIAACDDEIAGYQQQIRDLEHEKQGTSPAQDSVGATCPECGSPMGVGDRFCSKCGCAALTLPSDAAAEGSE